MSSSLEVIAAAKHYIGQGYALVAVKADKKPWGLDWRRQFSKEEILSRLRGPECVAIGFLGGELNRYIVPLDFDSDAGEAWWRTNCDAFGIDPDDFPTVITPGKLKDGKRTPGRHRYVRDTQQTLGNAEGDLKPLGINVRGAGHAMLPPSPHPDGGNYYWAVNHQLDDFEIIPPCPDFVYDAIKAAKKIVPQNGSAIAPATFDERGLKYAAGALSNQFSEISNWPQGGRNNALNNSALKMGAMVAAGWLGRKQVEDALLEAASRCGLVGEDGEKQCRATIKSGLEAGLKTPHAPLSENQKYRPEHPVFFKDYVDRKISAVERHRAEANSGDTPSFQGKTILDYFSLSSWHQLPVPERDWLIQSVLLRRSITLFSGDGGTGKSLFVLQLQIAAALGIDWLGLSIKKPLQSLAIYCEDDEDEIHRRAHDICKHYGASFKDVGERVHFMCRVGEASELVEFGGGYKENARPNKTPLFDQISDHVSEHKTRLVIVDTISDTFAGNENIRPQVRAFVTMLRGLSLINNGGVILNSHPSRAGMNDGSGFSGSTAWNGSVRNRLYLTVPKQTEDEEEGPTNDRVLKIMKSNYGPFGEKINCRWEQGVFVRTDTGNGSLIDRLTDDVRIVKAVEYVVSNGGRIAANPNAKNSLAASVRKLPSCRDLSYKLVCSAQDRLLENGKLVKLAVGPASRRFVLLRPPHLRYPDEKDEPASQEED